MAEEREIDYGRIASIMLPHAIEAEERVEEAGTRFVHYTNAQAALEILKTRCETLTCMNDYQRDPDGVRADLGGNGRGEFARSRTLLERDAQGFAKIKSDAPYR